MKFAYTSLRCSNKLDLLNEIHQIFCLSLQLEVLHSQTLMLIRGGETLYRWKGIMQESASPSQFGSVKVESGVMQWTVNNLCFSFLSCI